MQRQDAATKPFREFKDGRIVFAVDADRELAGKVLQYHKCD